MWSSLFVAALPLSDESSKTRGAIFRPMPSLNVFISEKKKNLIHFETSLKFFSSLSTFWSDVNRDKMLEMSINVPKQKSFKNLVKNKEDDESEKNLVF